MEAEVERVRNEKFSAASLFPVETKGPNKGKIILPRDE